MGLSRSDPNTAAGVAARREETVMPQLVDYVVGNTVEGCAFPASADERVE
jgi:hypothetical protein